MDARIEVDIAQAIASAGFRSPEQPQPVITDIFWAYGELYREVAEDVAEQGVTDADTDAEEPDVNGAE